MAYNQQDGGFQRAPRQMVTGNWTCSKCGAAITELPFQPDPSRLDQLNCRDCHRQARATFQPRTPRPMVQGNWQCSSCGTAITELPFNPDPAKLDGLLCRDCHRQKRASFQRSY